MMRISFAVIAILAITTSCGWAAEQATDSSGELLRGDFWRSLVLDEWAPLWSSHLPDEENGGFHTNLSRDWRPQPPWDKVPAMISRNVYSFSALFLLSGDESYLQLARQGVDYLLAHGWDKQYGGWFNRIAKNGAPVDPDKTVSLQLYTNAGLAMYYFVTGDERARTHVEQSLKIRQQQARDRQFGGYYYRLNRDLSVSDRNKSKHAHYGYVGSLAHYYLATRDADFLKWQQELLRLSAEKMIDSERGWIYGYRVKLNRRWQPASLEDEESVMIGAQLTAALAFIRLYHQSGQQAYRVQGVRLAQLAMSRGWDPTRGLWFDRVSREAPYLPDPDARVHWWVQIYGALLQLQLYHLTRDDTYLRNFESMERFFLRHFRDRKQGGIFPALSLQGELLGEGEKASNWHTSYHEIEHGLLNYLYLKLYVSRQPARLHFAFFGQPSPRQRFVSLVDDPAVHVVGVITNGDVEFDAEERSVTVPAGGRHFMEVTLQPSRALQ